MYGFNKFLVKHYTEIAHVSARIEKEKQAVDTLIKSLSALWQAHHPNRRRVRGMNLLTLVNDIKRTGRNLPPWQPLDQKVSEDILYRMMERAGAVTADPEETRANMQIWTESSGIGTIIHHRGSAFQRTTGHPALRAGRSAHPGAPGTAEGAPGAYQAVHHRGGRG